MKYLSLVMPVCALLWAFSSTAQAQSFDDFGIDDPELSQDFWEEAQGIINSSGATRGDTKGQDPFPTSAADLLKEAYRTDPEATLDLIERMLKAGKN
ncbi:hypothetical protein [Sulfitobacter sp.]|uniref:hypothetical protein n=1 Tax=Sulfitobacter sp. TaxID=1903071 RepID=UPI003EF4EAC5